MSDSEHEIWRRKGTVLNASAACSAIRSNGFWVALARRYLPFPPNPRSASKMSVLKMAVEELSVKDASKDQFQYLPGI
jgi:hypothetical protein